MSRVNVVSIDNCLNFYPKNLLQEIFNFRYEMVRRLGWSKGLVLQETSIAKSHSETDDQDKPGTVYFAKEDDDGNLIGVIRVSPSVDETGKPISMIRQSFNDLVDSDKGLPEDQKIWETSRILIDLERYNSPDARKKIVEELICSTFFFSHEKGIKGLFCFMAEGLWESTYKRLGLEVERLGPNKLIRDRRDYNVYAGVMKINDQVIESLIAKTSLSPSILHYGLSPNIIFNPVEYSRGQQLQAI